MSLKAELETWAAALKAYDEEDFEKALDLFSRIADSSKILTNMGLIYATLGEHEAAVEQFNAATQLDQYLAVAYVTFVPSFLPCALSAVAGCRCTSVRGESATQARGELGLGLATAKESADVIHPLQQLLPVRCLQFPVGTLRPRSSRFRGSTPLPERKSGY